jgi:hypothetical protein
MENKMFYNSIEEMDYERVLGEWNETLENEDEEELEKIADEDEDDDDPFAEEDPQDER